MEINQEFLERVATNARLELTKEEQEEFLPQFKEILEFFETLKEFDEDLEPSFHPIEIKDSLREDELIECLTVDQALSQTEQKKDDSFKGPKAI